MNRTGVVMVSALALAGCATQQDSEQALLHHGYSAAYVAGYHDGCPSGKRVGGNPMAQPAKDAAAFAQGGDYQTGWNYGYIQCRNAERQNEATASAIGAAIAAGMRQSHGADGVDVRDILDGIDTSGLEALEQ